MADAISAAVTSAAAVVTPIYDAMLERAYRSIMSGDKLDAADMLTTAAETMRRFQHHHEAMRIASWARDLLDA